MQLSSQTSCLSFCSFHLGSSAPTRVCSLALKMTRSKRKLRFRQAAVLYLLSLSFERLTILERGQPRLPIAWPPQQAAGSGETRAAALEKEGREEQTNLRHSSPARGKGRLHPALFAHHNHCSGETSTSEGSCMQSGACRFTAGTDPDLKSKQTPTQKWQSERFLNYKQFCQTLSMRTGNGKQK
jgi:hypothetical protein